MREPLTPDHWPTCASVMKNHAHSDGTATPRTAFDVESQDIRFLHAFHISDQFLWPSAAPLQLGACRLRRGISHRTVQRVVFRIARVVKTPQF